MTRGKWVALAVVVAVIAVLVPYGPVLWRAVAYQRYQRELGISEVGFYYLHKRASWLPGDEFLVPDQPCNRCLQWDHERCGVILEAEPVVLPPEDFRCTCTDPSHDGDSE